MLSKKEFLKEEKDCADMLGLSVKKYRESLKNNKIKKEDVKKNKYDNSVLSVLGLTEKDLKRRGML